MGLGIGASTSVGGITFDNRPADFLNQFLDKVGIQIIVVSRFSCGEFYGNFPGGFATECFIDGYQSIRSDFGCEIDNRLYTFCLVVLNVLLVPRGGSTLMRKKIAGGECEQRDHAECFEHGIVYFIQVQKYDVSFERSYPFYRYFYLHYGIFQRITSGVVSAFSSMDICFPIARGGIPQVGKRTSGHGPQVETGYGSIRRVAFFVTVELGAVDLAVAINHPKSSYDGQILITEHFGTLHGEEHQHFCLPLPYAFESGELFTYFGVGKRGEGLNVEFSGQNFPGGRFHVSDFSGGETEVAKFFIRKCVDNFRSDAGQFRGDSLPDGVVGLGRYLLSGNGVDQGGEQIRNGFSFYGTDPVDDLAQTFIRFFQMINLFFAI